MNNQDILEMFKHMTPIPLPTYDGMVLPSAPVIRIKGADKVMTDIKNLQTRDTDILICTFGKSGTHWIYGIVNMLLQNTTELINGPKADTMLEIIMDLNRLDSLPSPRVLNTHLKFKYLPQKFIQDKGKIVHMIRNPKDACVSSYHHATKDKFTLFKGSFNEFFDLWMQGESFPHGPWFDYELEMEQAEREHTGMIHMIYYEVMKREPECEIKKLAKFLGVTGSDKMATDIAIATSFKNMKLNKVDVTKLITDDGEGFIYRKGEIGNWKNYLTVSE